MAYIRGVGLLLALCAGLPARTEPPHVLLIVVDDLGWRDLGCQGNPRLQTPRLDALAKQGVRFTQAYAASPVCSPSRGALITGLAPARLRITQHGKDGAQFWPANRKIQPPAAEHILPLQATTIAERLKAAGYATGFFGKWHLSGEPGKTEPGGPEFWPDRQGFDVNVGGCGLGGPPTYFDPYRIPSLPPRRKGEYLTERLADEAIAFLGAHTSKPKFVCLWTYNVHYPFEAPEDLVEKYRGKEGPGLKNAVYGAQVEATDRAVGRVLDALDTLNLAGNTVVLFTSDNGGWEGATHNQPLRSGKGDLFEGGLRVPLLVRWPGQMKQAGATQNTPVIGMDLAATVLDAAGVSAQGLDGVSLRPLLLGQPIARKELFFHYPHFAFHRSNRPGAALRSGAHKLIRRFDDASLELYDLDADPGESRNLAAEQPAVAADLDAVLDRWLAETKAQLPTPR